MGMEINTTALHEELANGNTEVTLRNNNRKALYVGNTKVATITHHSGQPGLLTVDTIGGSFDVTKGINEAMDRVADIIADQL